MASRHNCLMAEFVVSLGDDQLAELAQLAREARVTEEEIVREAIDRLLQSHRGPGTPPFARRLGPLAIPKHEPSTDAAGELPST